MMLSVRDGDSLKGTHKGIVGCPDLGVDCSAKGRWGQDEGKKTHILCESHLLSVPSTILRTHHELPHLVLTLRTRKLRHRKGKTACSSWRKWHTPNGIPSPPRNPVLAMTPGFPRTT